MHRKSLTLLFSLIVICMPVAALEIEGIHIPDTHMFTDGNATLVLNGAGLREKFFLDIYIGALYLPAKTPDTRAILSDTGPASVLMHILHSEISKKKITAGWEDGLTANLTNKEMKSLRPRLEKFNGLFLTTRKGDEIRIDYRPATGTEVRINGEWRGVIEGNDFYRSLLKIWLGTSPVSKSLKQAMLGID